MYSLQNKDEIFNSYHTYNNLLAQLQLSKQCLTQTHCTNSFQNHILFKKIPRVHKFYLNILTSFYFR